MFMEVVQCGCCVFSTYQLPTADFVSMQLDLGSTSKTSEAIVAGDSKPGNRSQLPETSGQLQWSNIDHSCITGKISTENHMQSPLAVAAAELQLK